MSRSWALSPATRKHAASLLLYPLIAGVLPWAAVPAFAAQVTADSLAGYWKFDETSGTSAADVSGHGRTGTHTNGPTISSDVPSTIAFQNSRSLSFDGTNDVTVLPSTPISTDFSIAMWLDLGTWGGGSEGVIDRSGGGGTAVTTTIWRFSSTVTFYTNDGTSTDSLAHSSWPSGWHHVVFTHDSALNKRIYIDGIVVASKTSSVTPTDSGGNWNLAALSSLGAFANAQKVDDLRIYSRALSPWEVAELAAGRHVPAYWTGTNSTGFENKGNWSGSYIPDPYSRLVVQARNNQPAMTGALQLAALTIQTGASLKANGTGITINDSGPFINHGTLILKGSETLTNFTNDTSRGTVLYYGTGSLSSLPAGLNYHNLNLNDGLVGYWKFDETSGTRAADSSGYGNSGSLIGGPTISTTVAPTNFANARSLSFDGAGDYIETGQDAAFDFTEEVTISAWIKRDGSTGTWQSVVAKTTGSNNGYGLLVDNSVANTVTAWIGGSSRIVDQSLPAGWNHVAMAYNRALSSQHLKLYVNGILAGTNSAGGAIATNELPLRIGSKSDAAANYFNGQADDIRIYNRALSAGEIAALAAGNQPSTGRATVTLAGNLDVNGDLILNGGTLDVSSSNHAITIGGSLLNHGGTFAPRKGTVTFDGTSSTLQVLSGDQQFNNVTFNGAGTWTLADRLTASGTLALASGTLDANTDESFTVRAGTINQTAGTFLPRSGIVVLTSPANATATITSPLNELHVEDSTEQGLVGYWKFDEGTNTGAILDSSEFGNHGVRRGSGAIWTGATLPSNIQFENPYVMRFNGKSDYVDAGPLSESALTVSLWLKPATSITSSGPNMGLLDFDSASDSSSRIFGYTGNFTGSFAGETLTFTSNAQNAATYITTALDTNWHHLVITSNGSVYNQVYVDGMPVTTNVVGGGAALWNADVILGGGSYASTFVPYNGHLDDVRIYSRALSANEVMNLYRGRYAAGSAGTATFTLGGHLTAGTLKLHSGNLNTGTYNATLASPLQLLRGNGSLTLGAGTATLNGGLTVSGSSLAAGSGPLDINGSVSILTGSLVAPSGNLTVSGDWTYTGGTFAHNSGSVLFDGSAAQNLRGSTTFASLTISASSARTVSVQSGITLTVLDDLTLEGTSSALLALAPLTASTTWYLDVADDSDQSVEYVSVSYSDASGGAVILAHGGTNTDSGNNDNWLFTLPSVSFLSGSLTLSETSGSAAIVLNLSGTSLLNITIPFSITGTATGTGSDYTVLTPSPLIIEVGESSTGILLQFLNDGDVESDETIILTLGTPTNATVGATGSTTITLTSDDVAPAASSSSSESSSQPVQQSGGRRGSGESMRARIETAYRTILARFEGIREVSDRLFADDERRQQEIAGRSERDRELLAAKLREERIAQRINEHHEEIARLKREQEKLQQQFPKRARQSIRACAIHESPDDRAAGCVES